MGVAPKGHLLPREREELSSGLTGGRAGGRAAPAQQSPSPGPQVSLGWAGPHLGPRLSTQMDTGTPGAGLDLVGPAVPGGVWCPSRALPLSSG